MIILEEIFALIDQFERSNGDVLVANNLELVLDDNFPDDDFIQHTVEILARYQPEGGQFLYDTRHVRTRLSETREYLIEQARPID